MPCHPSVLHRSGTGCKSKSADADSGKLQIAWITYPTYSTVEDYEDFTGSAKADKMVVVTPRATGHLDKVNFKDGEIVKEGDVLCEIDPREYRTALDRTQGGSPQGPDLREPARSRPSPQRRSGGHFGGPAGFRKTHQRSGPGPEPWCAWPRPTNERLNTTLAGARSPPRSAAGSAAGSLIPATSSKRNRPSLPTSSPSIPCTPPSTSTSAPFCACRKTSRTASCCCRRTRRLRVKIALSDDKGYAIDGKISFVDNKIDTGTGTLVVRATFDNTLYLEGTWPWERPSNYRLQPGLFVRVRLPISEPRQALLIPERAIGSDQGRKMVYVVNTDHVTEYRPVKLGSQQGKLRVIESGIKEGEMVVVKGLQRMKDKLKVEPKEDKGDGN